jgi:hypothetical protein
VSDRDIGKEERKTRISKTTTTLKKQEEELLSQEKKEKPTSGRRGRKGLLSEGRKKAWSRQKWRF